MPKKEHKVTDYHDFTKKDSSPELRRKYDVGDLWINAIVCFLCDTFVRSRNRHDYRHCPCGNVMIDGGSWYGRYGGKEGTYQLVTVKFDKVLSLEEQLANEEWPTTKKPSRASSAKTTGKRTTKSARTSPSSSRARSVKSGRGTKPKKGKG